jgi:hypothetical protein
VGITGLAVCRYVLSEFADVVPNRSPAQLAEEITPRLALAPVATQGLLLTALMKLRMHALHDKDLQRHVEEVFTEYASDANTDIQQRAVEYLAYSKMGDNEILRQEVFAPMPDWPDKVMLVSQVRSAPCQHSTELPQTAVSKADGSSFQRRTLKLHVTSSALIWLHK